MNLNPFGTNICLRNNRYKLKNGLHSSRLQIPMKLYMLNKKQLFLEREHQLSKRKFRVRYNLDKFKFKKNKNMEKPKNLNYFFEKTRSSSCSYNKHTKSDKLKDLRKLIAYNSSYKNNIFKFFHI